MPEAPRLVKAIASTARKAHTRFTTGVSRAAKGYDAQTGTNITGMGETISRGRNGLLLEVKKRIDNTREGALKIIRHGKRSPSVEQQTASAPDSKATPPAETPATGEPQVDAQTPAQVRKTLSELAGVPSPLATTPDQATTLAQTAEGAKQGDIPATSPEVAQRALHDQEIIDRQVDTRFDQIDKTRRDLDPVKDAAKKAAEKAEIANQMIGDGTGDLGNLTHQERRHEEIKAALDARAKADPEGFGKRLEAARAAERILDERIAGALKGRELQNTTAQLQEVLAEPLKAPTPEEHAEWLEKVKTDEGYKDYLGLADRKKTLAESMDNLKKEVEADPQFATPEAKAAEVERRRVEAVQKIGEEDKTFVRARLGTAEGRAQLKEIAAHNPDMAEALQAVSMEHATAVEQAKQAGAKGEQPVEATKPLTPQEQKEMDAAAHVKKTRDELRIAEALPDDNPNKEQLLKSAREAHAAARDALVAIRTEGIKPGTPEASELLGKYKDKIRQIEHEISLHGLTRELEEQLKDARENAAPLMQGHDLVSEVNISANQLGEDRFKKRTGSFEDRLPNGSRRHARNEIKRMGKVFAGLANDEITESARKALEQAYENGFPPNKKYDKEMGYILTKIRERNRPILKKALPFLRLSQQEKIKIAELQLKALSGQMNDDEMNKYNKGFFKTIRMMLWFILGVFVPTAADVVNSASQAEAQQMGQR